MGRRYKEGILPFKIVATEVNLRCQGPVPSLLQPLGSITYTLRVLD